MNETPKTLFGNKFKSQKNTTYTRKEVSHLEASKVATDKHHAEIAKSNFAKYGTGKLTSEGTVARLSGISYPNLDNITDGDRQSFYYGYYDRGNTNIKILIETGSTSIPLLTDNIMKVYQEINRIFGLNKKEMPYEELDDETKYNEILRVIGFNDGRNKEIDFEKLSEVIRNCIPYKEGFELGREYLENINNNKHR